MPPTPDVEMLVLVVSRPEFDTITTALFDQSQDRDDAAATAFSDPTMAVDADSRLGDELGAGLKREAQKLRDLRARLVRTATPVRIAALTGDSPVSPLVNRHYFNDNLGHTGECDYPSCGKTEGHRIHFTRG